MVNSVRKDVTRLLDEARRQGFTVERAGSGHFKLRSPSGAIVVIAFSPSSGHALHSARRDLRRAGFKEEK